MRRLLAVLLLFSAACGLSSVVTPSEKLMAAGRHATGGRYGTTQLRSVAGVPMFWFPEPNYFYMSSLPLTAHSAAQDAPFSRTLTITPSDTLVLQFEAYSDGPLACSGLYLKLLRPGSPQPPALPADSEQQFGGTWDDLGSTALVFGPATCGAETDRVLLAVTRPNGTRHELLPLNREDLSGPGVRPRLRPAVPHLYRLVAHPDVERTVEIFVDGHRLYAASSLTAPSDWTPPFVPPRTVTDVDAMPPADWPSRFLLADGRLVPNPDFVPFVPSLIPNPEWDESVHGDMCPFCGDYGALAFDLFTADGRLGLGRFYVGTDIAEADAVAEAHPAFGFRAAAATEAADAQSQAALQKFIREHATSLLTEDMHPLKAFVMRALLAGTNRPWTLGVAFLFFAAICLGALWLTFRTVRSWRPTPAADRLPVSLQAALDAARRANPDAAKRAEDALKDAAARGLATGAASDGEITVEDSESSDPDTVAPRPRLTVNMQG
jgi:hypothetical protein